LIALLAENRCWGLWTTLGFPQATSCVMRAGSPQLQVSGCRVRCYMIGVLVADCPCSQLLIDRSSAE